MADNMGRPHRAWPDAKRPGHELSGVVVELGYGTTGLTVGQRVFGLTDWTRNGSLAEYAAVEARNLAPLPADVDYAFAAALPISGMTAWQGLIDHGRLTAAARRSLPRGKRLLIARAVPWSDNPVRSLAGSFTSSENR